MQTVNKRFKSPFHGVAAAVVGGILSLSLAGCGVLWADQPDIADVALADDDGPRLYEGPNTALLENSDITPITENPEPQLPVTFTGMDDVDVEVIDTSRILALDGTGSLASVVWALGFGPDVVGRDLVTGWDSAKDLPLVMDNHSLNAESILELNPSVVLTDYSVGPYDVQLQLRNAGIPVIFFEGAENLEDIPRMITDVATALGVPELGEQYVDEFNDRLEETLAKIYTIAPKSEEDKVRMVFLYMRGRAGIYHMYGNNPDGTKGMAGILIEKLGGVDVAGEENWTTGGLTAEGLMNLEPDMYLMLTLGLESVGGVEGLSEIPGIAQTPAGQRHRVVDMSDYEMFTWGPRTPEVLTALAEAIYRVELDDIELSDEEIAEISEILAEEDAA